LKKNTAIKLKIMRAKYILTDIEGTTSSVQFVYSVLFPYFREHCHEIKEMTSNLDIQQAIKKTVELSATLENKKITSVDAVIDTLIRWSLEDRKVTPLKTIQGILWQKGYESGEIKGHVYVDVAPALEGWEKVGLKLGVFSSGSIAAQKLLFQHSEAGDLTPHFSNYFDTTTGGKRETSTYTKIAEEINESPNDILFLSDIIEELVAADEAGFQTIQLLREETIPAWKTCVHTFNEITL
jgi:enolase-phosphatase E1